MPKVIVATDPEDLARQAAGRLGDALADAIRSRGRAALALSGGGTPIPTYRRLAQVGGWDATKVEIFWVDERAVPPTHPRSNFGAAEPGLRAIRGLDAERIHRMEADDPDLAAANQRYEALVRGRVAVDSDGVPIFDVLVLGIGDDGHIASLFPGRPEVRERSRSVLSVPEAPGREARMTLTAPVLERARLSLVLVTGASKASALARAWAPTGSLEETPSRLLQSATGDVVWMLDAAAAGR